MCTTGAMLLIELDNPAMNDAIAFALEDGVCYLKLSGELRHHSAGPLDALIERIFARYDCPISGVVIDLNGATFMDSTVIGLLAGIARELFSRKLEMPTLFSTQPEINQLLHSLRLDEVFKLVEASIDQPIDAAMLYTLRASSNAEEQCSAAAILKAHETLIELNDANRVAFQPVVDLVRQEVERRGSAWSEAPTGLDPSANLR